MGRGRAICCLGCGCVPEITNLGMTKKLKKFGYGEDLLGFSSSKQPIDESFVF